MKVKPKILRRKFIGDIPEKEMRVIEKACEIDKRSRISLIRKASVEFAEKILEIENARTK